MKLFFQTIVLLFCQNLFCQEYHFDNFIEYKELNGRINFHLTNSANSSYHLNSGYGSETIYGKIRDTENNLFHEYEVVNENNNIKFNYLFSRKYNPENHKTHLSYKITERKIDSINTEFKIIVFKNKKRKKIDFKIEIIVENSNDLFCYELLTFYTHTIFLKSDFKIEKGFISKIKVERENGSNNEYNLIKKQKISTLLKISKEQIQYR